jgi:hypothetical protein
MGVDTRMIAGVRACITFAQTDPHLAIQTTPHNAETLGAVRTGPAQLVVALADHQCLLMVVGDE